MPSTSTSHNPETAAPGTLYVVATPLGNPRDITLRALDVLGTVDLVAAEDTRDTGRLLAAHGIRTATTAYHEHNESARTPGLLEKLAKGQSIAVVSDAGTPTVSDPGYRLVTAAVEAGIPVIPIPGPSAAITALSVSGLPSDRFLFVGFPAKKKKQRKEQLARVANETATLIFYESPKRIVSLLEEITAVMGERHAVLGRELTKTHEEIIRGPLETIRQALTSRRAVKGECTLLVSGKDTSVADSMDTLHEMIRARLGDGTPISALARELARETGIQRSLVYETILKFGKENSTD